MANSVVTNLIPDTVLVNHDVMIGVRVDSPMPGTGE